MTCRAALWQRQASTFCTEALRPRGFPSQLLRLAVLAALLAGPSGQLVGEETGLLAEYFLSFTDTCQVGGNGSVDILAGRVPNFTRIDKAVNFVDRLAFSVKRCAWSLNEQGSLKHVCRASDEATRYFAVRWTGYLMVRQRGSYTFQMDADDGARVIIGNGRCPSSLCGPWQETMNLRLDDLATTLQRDSTWAKYCTLCDSGVYGDCWVSDNGCEPFIQWQMEADGGLSGSCSSGRKVTEGNKWMEPGLHPIKIEYFQRGGPAVFTLKYKGPDADASGANGGFLGISARNLIYPQFKGLTADWFEMPDNVNVLPDQSALGTVPGATFLRTEDDAFIDHGPGAGSFSQRVYDEFQDRGVLIRWSGFMKINTPGTYTFELTSDDGGRLIMAGRGGQRERIMLDNDGIQDRGTTVSTETEIMAGLHAIRIFYFYRPGYVTTVPTPPGIEIRYSGADTGDVMRPFATAMNSNLQKNDPTCQMTNWRWGQGLSVSRDCQGRCADTNEGLLGDGLCDQGILLLGSKTLDLKCEAYNFDNSDCESRVYDLPPTPRPQVECFESCPAGGYKRNRCLSCPNGTLDNLCLKKTAPLCVPPADQPDACSNLGCCVAHVSGLEGWGSDCIAFGTATNCTDQLAIMLENLREEPMDLYSGAFYDEPETRGLNPRPVKTGYLMKSCDEPRCNTIPSDFMINPRTNLPTDQPVCPIGESDPGIMCYEGPWDVTNVNTPKDECEGGPRHGKYEWNFCKNTKTSKGKSFVRCCTFAYQNAMGKGECRFVGLPYGKCEDWILELQDSLSLSQWTRISNPAVLQECDKDNCNDPSDEEKGCPHVVDIAPPQTADTNTPEPGFVDTEAMMAGAVEAKGEGPPWLIIGLIAACVLSLCLILLVIRELSKEAPFSPWHSDKAHIVADDTWIEPEQDADTELQYGVIKPRPPGFNMLVKEQKTKAGHSFKPKALEDGGALSDVTPQAQIDNLRAAADAGSSPNDVALAIQSRRSTKMSQMSVASSGRRGSVRGSVLSNIPGSEAGESALALEDVQEEEDESVTAEDYDGIHLPHMVEIRLNQLNPAALSRPPAADRAIRQGWNNKPMVQTICT